MSFRTSFKRPASAIPHQTGFVALISIPVIHFLWPNMPSVSDRDQTVLFLVSVFAVLALFEILFVKIYRLSGSGLVFNQKNFTELRYISDLWVKFVGLTVSLGILALFYYSAEIYHGDWYEPFFSLLADHWGIVFSILVGVVALVHFLMRNPRDGMWHLGKFVLKMGNHSVHSDSIQVYLLGLGIKGFFLPLMFCYLVYDWSHLQSRSLWSAKDFSEVYEYLFRFSFFFDLTLVVIGYATATRLLISHVRWAETTVSGWLVCVVCYAPFWQLLSRDYFNYVEDGFAWGIWLWDHPVLYFLWGSTILLLLLIYCLATAKMGLRFSNLTYRGLACDFPYSFSKHPAYVSKNITWWLISIPFIAIDFWTGIANCTALLGVNMIYFLRARYEESCLSRAPSYRAYKLYIDESGLLAKVRRRMLGLVSNVPIGSNKVSK